MGGNCQPDGKGVHREVESEEEAAGAGLTNRNCIGGAHAG
jgi:hypothetical protein